MSMQRACALATTLPWLSLWCCLLAQLGPQVAAHCVRVKAHHALSMCVCVCVCACPFAYVRSCMRQWELAHVQNQGMPFFSLTNAFTLGSCTQCPQRPPAAASAPRLHATVLRCTLCWARWPRCAATCHCLCLHATPFRGHPSVIMTTTVSAGVLVCVCVCVCVCLRARTRMKRGTGCAYAVGMCSRATHAILLLAAACSAHLLEATCGCHCNDLSMCGAISVRPCVG